MFEFEVSVHRATTALKKLNRRRKDLIDEAVRVCSYCETDHARQMGNCSLGAKMDSACPWRASIFELPAVQSLRIHPFTGTEVSLAFRLASGQ